MRVRLPSLLGVGPHADVAVADGEQRLGQTEVGGGELALDEPPRVDREPMLGQAVGGDVLLHAESPPGKVCMRSPTTMSAPLVSKASGPAPRSMPSTSAKPPARPAATPDTASSTTTVRPGSTCSSRGRLEEHVGCRLPGETETVGDVAVDDDREPLGQASGVEDVGGVARRRDDCHCDLHLVEEIEHPDRTREGDDALRGQRLAEQRVLAIAERADRGIAGRIARVAVGQHDVARLEERTHPVEAGFAVDVGEVVVERERRLGRVGAAGEEVVEHRASTLGGALPRSGSTRRRGRTARRRSRPTARGAIRTNAADRGPYRMQNLPVSCVACRTPVALFRRSPAGQPPNSRHKGAGRAACGRLTPQRRSTVGAAVCKRSASSNRRRRRRAQPAASSSS